MKLYYATSTCSMAIVNAVEELGIPCEMKEVSWDRSLNVDELNRTNPLGLTPTLVLDDGKVLTQNIAILEFLADQKPAAALLAPVGSKERADTMSWAAFVASDLQKAFTPAFRAELMTDDPKAQKSIESYTKTQVQGLLKHVDGALKGKEYICGSKFTVADCYLHVILGWAEWIDIELNQYPELVAYQKRVGARPAIQRATALENN